MGYLNYLRWHREAASHSFWKNAKWKKTVTLLPRRCVYTNTWHWNTIMFEGEYGYIEADGRNGMVFVTVKHWITEESLVIAKLTFKEE